MVKKKTSKKQNISIEDYQPRKLKSNIGIDTTVGWATEGLKDKEHIAKALVECIIDYDMESFKEILSAHLRVTNKDELAKKTGISKRTLFRMVSEEGNPTLENASKVIHELCA